MERKIVKVATPIPPDATPSWVKGQVVENVEAALVKAHSMGGVIGEMKVLLVVEQEVLIERKPS